jgi:hypothetical protein
MEGQPVPRFPLCPFLTAILVCTCAARAELHIFIADAELKHVVKINAAGAVLWQADNNNGQDVQLLKNGNVLVNCLPAVREYSPDGKIVWEAGKEVAASPDSVQRLENGNTLIGDNAKHRVIEIDRDKKIVWSFDIPNSNNRALHTMRRVRRLDNGNTLIAASSLDKVLEVSRERNTVWEYAIPFPCLAVRLANGNTMISSGEKAGSPPGNFVVEVDPMGKTVWKYGCEDAPADQKLNWPSGFVRLPNGNLLIAEAHAGQLREVSPDKKTVRIIKSPAAPHPCSIVVVDE